MRIHILTLSAKTSRMDLRELCKALGYNQLLVELFGFHVEPPLCQSIHVPTVHSQKMFQNEYNTRLQ